LSNSLRSFAKSFETVETVIELRKGRNPQTGDDLVFDARRVVTFKGSGVLRERLNKRKPKTPFF